LITKLGSQSKVKASALRLGAYS